MTDLSAVGQLDHCTGRSRNTTIKTIKLKQMKKVYMVLILSLFACKTGQEAAVAVQKEPLLHYSKGPCLGRCPVYDFWIYPDGTFSYKRAKGGTSNREIKGRLATEEIKRLKTFLQHDLGTPVTFKRIRDLPVSKLRFNGKKYEYHASKTKGPLKKANRYIEEIVRGITRNHRLPWTKMGF